MRRTIADLFEHLVGATITFGIAAIILKFGPSLAQSLAPNEYFDELYLFILIVSVILLAVVISFSHQLLRWINFRALLNEGKVCSLYIEAYFIRDKSGQRVPVISLMVVHFDLHARQYQICGHSFVRDQKSKELVHRAHWRTLAAHHDRNSDDCGIFYVHEGFLTGETNKMRGTTFCDLPFSPRSTRGGSFCDLEAPKVEPDGTTAGFPATKFEVVRALDRDIKEFRIGMEWPTRWKCYLNLAAPSEEYFISFARKKDRTLMEDPDRKGVPRGGEMMREVWEKLAL